MLWEPEKYLEYISGKYASGQAYQLNNPDFTVLTVEMHLQRKTKNNLLYILQKTGKTKIKKIFW